MDFIEKITEAINTTVHLPVKLRKGYLGDNESLVIYPLPGSTVTQRYMDGTRDVDMNYEIAMKSKDGDRINQTLWSMQDYIDKVTNVHSEDGSFYLNNIKITSKPFINEADEQGWFVFLFDFTANLTIEEEKINGI